MCGILGLWRFDRPLDEADQAWARLALQRMHRRGPDSRGLVQVAPNCLLAAARLRISDPCNQAADQPFRDHATGNVLVFNGQIYNQQELRCQLEGEEYRTQSDTETLVRAYRVWGPRCVEHFEGMFSFAVWNPHRKVLDVAVDPTRQKPLFYVNTANIFAFSSELESLLLLPGLEARLNPSAVCEALTFRMNVAPDTVWEPISKLPPGVLLRVRQGGQVDSLRYFHVPLPDKTHEGKELLDGAIEDTTRSCAEVATAEHPSAVLLSGGVDSSVVAALLARQGINPLAISIGFAPEGDEGELFHEFKYSSTVAQAAGLEHLKLVLDAATYCRALEEWLAVAEEPFASLESVCLYRIFKELGERGVKVAYTGTGPDEMLDGYRLGELLSRGAQRQDVAEAFFDRFTMRGVVDLARLMGEPFNASKSHTLEKLHAILEPYDGCGLSISEQVQVINTHVHLPEYEHRQMDFSSMQFGIEARNPLCSRRLMHRWFSATAENRTCSREEKYLWKLVAEPFVGPTIAWRKKRGFPVPGYVRSHPLFEDMIDQVLDPQGVLVGDGYLNPEYLRSIRGHTEDEYRKVFFRLVVLEKILSRQRGLVRSKHDTEALMPSFVGGLEA